MVIDRVQFGRKFGQVILISAVVGLTLLAIYFLTQERNARRWNALNSITENWGGVQKITGPIWIVPYDAKTEVTENDPQTGKEKTVLKPTRNYVYILPKTQKVEVELLPEKRKRGIYETLIYQSKTKITGHFDQPVINLNGVSSADLAWQEARVVFQIGDPAGLAQAPQLLVNDASIGGFQKGLYPQSDKAKFGWLTDKDDENYPERRPVFYVMLPNNANKAWNYELNLSLRGSEDFQIKPVASDTTMSLKADWPNLSSSGNIMPIKLENGKTSQATWQVPAASMSIPAIFRVDGRNSYNNIAIEQLDFLPSIGVKIWNGTDGYDSVLRALKYGVLLIGLTLLILMLFDLLGRLYLHWTQYMLSGLAVSMFYLLLLSISEHLSFDFSYLIAAIATSALITAYAISVLRSRQKAFILASALTALHVIFYAILKQEDYALLMGSILLLLALAITMYFTRNINAIEADKNI